MIKKITEIFELDLDGFFTDGYEGGCYPENDIFGQGHYGACLLNNKEKYKKRFLEEMAKRFEINGVVKKVKLDNNEVDE